MGQSRSGRSRSSGDRGGGESATEQARQQSREVAQQARQQASQYADEGRERAKSQLATQKERAAGQLEGVAQALQQTGEQLREQDQDPIARYVDRAAEQVERFSGFLRDRDADQLIREAESRARRQPAVFLGGAFALGLVAARFLKSSSSQGSASGATDRRSSTGGVRRESESSFGKSEARGFTDRGEEGRVRLNRRPLGYEE